MRYDCAVKVVTSAVMRELDRQAICDVGIPGMVLMENAGRAVFEHLCQRFGPVAGRLFVVLCGTGNNGGDGFVAARHLRLAGARVHLHLAGDPDRLRGDARSQFQIAGQMGLRPGEGPPPSGIKVDALLGTGAKGPPRGEVADAIRWMNADANPTVAVDIPSGVDSDTGSVAGEAVCATSTVTFGYPKAGLLVLPGALYAGEVVVSPIGMDWDVLEVPSGLRWIRSSWLAGHFGPRPASAHKGDFGHLLVVGGSRGMGGAPAMAGRAALRMGAGLVTIAAPGSVQPQIAARMDECMTLPLPEEDGMLGDGAVQALAEIAGRCDAACVGPGAGRGRTAQQVLARFFQALDRPLVIDADGLNALACHLASLDSRRAPTVLTPHPGECARLLGCDSDRIQADRMAAAREAAQRFRCVVVLKGARTLVADGRPGHAAEVGINTTGNPGMATGGTGDVLAGMIGALLARGIDAYEAACAGVYVHGRAGDIAAERLGQSSLVAGDVIEAVPAALREIEGER